jgi:tetratricopeptide (TPR) repeat protein/predicted Ser/Thr protein kinase
MIGTFLNQRYRLDAELGRGGMGVIYRAHDALLDRTVAVKVLTQRGLGSQGRARLLREAQAAARLNHPNIVAVYDAGETDGLPFIVMEYVPGTSLHDQPPAEIERIVSVAQQLCAALGHAHEHGIVHRDLKPENVIMEADGNVKLTDFGLARSREASRLTQEDALVGTTFYLAPEQALGGELDGRADLYALGVLLYELLTGRLPFTGDDPLAIISQHLHAPAVPPSTFRPDLPAALEAIVLKLLAKDPADRFASAGEVTLALDRAMAGPPGPESFSQPPPTRAVALLQQLAAGRLVGRQAELRRLRELWAHAQAGHSHLALISGEPGVGKTRLASELMVVAQLNGALILRGNCYEYEATTPYLPIIEAVRAWVHDQAPAELRDYLDNTAPEILKLAPEIEAKLGPIAPNAPLSPDEERLRLYDGVARFFQRLAAGRGMLLFVDDLHWADRGTVHLLHYLLRQLRDDPVLVLAAYREVELGRAQPLADALIEWNRERLATRVALDRLSQPESEALLAALFHDEEITPEFGQAIYTETEGNPFFIEEVVKALVEQGVVYRQAGRWERKAIEELVLPQSVKEAIGRRLNRLSAACVDVLHTASALGKTFEYTELAMAANVEEDQLLDALDEAVAAQIMRPAGGESFSFTHDKIREVLYEELNPIRRRRLHQRVGEHLERLYQGPIRDDHVQDLAYHFLQSGDFEKGLSYALRAAEQAQSVYALEDALGYYQQAADCADGLHRPGQLAEVYRAIGDVQMRRGLFYEARDAFEQALALVTTREERAVLKTRIGTAYAQPGDERGLSFLHEAQAELDPHTQPDELAHTLTMLGRYYHYQAQHQQSIEYLEQARELAEPLGQAPTLTYIYSFLAGAYQHLARYEPSMYWARQCIALGERQNYPSASAVGYEFLAETSDLAGKSHEALEYARLDQEIGQRIGSLDRVGWAAFSRAKPLFHLGNLKEARNVASSNLPLAERNGDKRLMVWLGGLLGLIEADMGLDEAAQVNAELALTWADETGQVPLQCWARRARAYLHLKHQEWEAALAVCREGETLYVPTENRVAPLHIGALAAEACWGAQRLEEAERRATDYLELTRETGSLRDEGVGLRVHGQVFMSQGRWDEADDALDNAVARLAELDCRLELGRALYRRAELRRARNRLDLAQADAGRARVIFEECGAPSDAQQVLGLWQAQPG